MSLTFGKWLGIASSVIGVGVILAGVVTYIVTSNLSASAAIFRTDDIEARLRVTEAEVVRTIEWKRLDDLRWTVLQADIREIKTDIKTRLQEKRP